MKYKHIYRIKITHLHLENLIKLQEKYLCPFIRKIMVLVSLVNVFSVGSKLLIFLRKKGCLFVVWDVGRKLKLFWLNAKATLNLLTC